MADTMKAIKFEQYGGPEVLQHVDVEKPQPGRGEILLKVEAVGVNYADTMRRQNAYLEPTPLPYIIGGELAGTVEALGPDVDSVKVGSRVMAVVGSNGYAQYAVVRARQTFSIPDNLSFAEATTIPVQGVTAYQVIKLSGQMQPGETVLVHAAAGGVGVYAVQVAKLLGAGKVIATASTEAKRDLAKSLGADVTVDYTQPEWFNEVLEHTKGNGVDVILEMVGGDIFKQNFKCLAKFGRMVVFGVASHQPSTLNPAQLMQRNHAVIGYWLVNTMGRPKLFAEAIQSLLGWIAEDKIKMVVEHTYPLSQAGQAHTMMESRQTVGKLVLLPHAE